MVLWLSSVGLADGPGCVVVGSTSTSVSVLVVRVKELEGVSSSDKGGCSVVDSDSDSLSG